MRSVQTDGATLILCFTLRKSDLDGEPASVPRTFNGSTFHHTLSEATRTIRETPIPVSIDKHKDIGGVTSLEHLRVAIDRANAHVDDAAERMHVRVRVVGCDPGRESLVYCAATDLKSASDYRWSDDDGQHVRDSTAESMEKTGAQFRMTSTQHLWLSGKMRHRRAELRWRAKCGADVAWTDMNKAGAWKTASIDSFVGRLACQIRPDNWKAVMTYTFGDKFALARMARRLRFCMQRHNAVTANIIAGLRRAKKKTRTGQRRKRGRRADRRRSHIRGRMPWVRPENRPTLTVIAMGNGVFSPCSRGYAPSSHRPYVKELASRPGVVVAMVDEFRTSKCCFRCGSQMAKGKRREMGDGNARGSRVVKCTRCIKNKAASDSSVPVSIATRNRDLNGAANMALLACRALTFGCGEKTRPRPWRRGANRTGIGRVRAL